MADIVSLVRADHLRAQQLFWAVLSGPVDLPVAIVAWQELPELLNAHMTAAEEVCHLALLDSEYGAARRDEAIADRADALEAMDEAMLCMAGSPQWQRLMLAAWRSSSAYFRWLDRALAQLAECLDAEARQRLASQWLGFRRAWAQDRAATEHSAPLLNRQLSGSAIRHL